jgi:tRNA (guanosine-2'-O-)-methyltransferase
MTDKEKFLEQFLTDDRKDRLEQVLEKRTDSLVIVLEHVNNYHNISAIIRSADAFGIQRLILVGDSFEYSKGITLGAERWVEVASYPTAKEAVSELKKAGFQLAVLQPEEYQKKGLTYQSIPIHQLPYNERLALVFGNERDGVSPELAAECDLHAYIPMFGFVDSFNISVAAAICMYASTISECKNERPLPPLTEERKREVHNKWLTKAVKRSDVILREVRLEEES